MKKELTTIHTEKFENLLGFKNPKPNNPVITPTEKKKI